MADFDALIDVQMKALIRQHFFDAQTDTPFRFADAGHFPKRAGTLLIGEYQPFSAAVAGLSGLHDGVGEVGLDGLP
ncbi:hypothetical protein D3C76_1231770 [compost metagenome]